MKITVIGNDTSGGERSNRIQMTHETVFHLLASNNQLLPRGCSRVESVCTGWKGRVVREGAIRCSVLAKLKTGWKLMGVRTVVAKYLHAGPGISIKVNPSRRRLAPPPGSSPFDRGNGIFFADKSRGVWGERDFEGVPIEFSTYLDCGQPMYKLSKGRNLQTPFAKLRRIKGLRNCRSFKLL